MVVSNTSPLNYLVLIDQIELLPALYGRVLIPQSVAEELKAPETPEVVREWIATLRYGSKSFPKFPLRN